MSNQLPQARQPTGAGNEAATLSPTEREQVHTLFSNPLEFPARYKGWLESYLEPQIHDVITRAIGRIPTPGGTPDGTKFWRDDNTWANPVGPGSEVAYDPFSSDVAIGAGATTEGTSVTVKTATAFTADGTFAYLIEFFAPRVFCSDTGSGDGMVFVLFEDGTAIGQIAEIGQHSTTTGSADNVPVHGFLRRVPASGSRTYAVKAYNLGGGAGTVNAGAGGAGTRVPGFIRITRAT